MALATDEDGARGMNRRACMLLQSGGALAIAIAVWGCAPLHTSSRTSRSLPAGRLAPDAVVLDVAFVRLKAADVQSYDAIWNAADEQRLDAELRGALERNGV